MNTYFKELAEAYKVSTSTTVKSALYDAMVSYSKTYRGDYSCYDMDMCILCYNSKKLQGVFLFERSTCKRWHRPIW